MRPSMIVQLLLLPAIASGQQLAAPTRTEVGPGVYLFQSAPYSDVGLDGNAVAIVSDDGVLVFDSNGTPASAELVLAGIRSITRAPVRYLVNSHWHWDHWYGAEVYRRANPDLQIITHEKTRELMAGPAIGFNQPGLDHQLPDHIRDIESRLAKAKASTGSAEERSGLERHLAADRFFLEQKRGIHPTLANITFTDRLTIHLGDRVVEVLHHDRAITPGDAYVYLPKERIVLTGDLLINPVTFALFCYPSGWIRTLERIDALDAAVLVPGHGAPLEDETLLHATLALLRRERTIAAESKPKGFTVVQAKDSVLADPEVQRLRRDITKGDQNADRAFPLYLVDWFVQRVYQELDGPLDDSIPKLP